VILRLSQRRIRGRRRDSSRIHDRPHIREPDQIRQGLRQKTSAVQFSPHFQAILGCLLGEDWTTPRLIEMKITIDGQILGRSDGQPGLSTFLGRPKDLLRNVHGVAKVADLDGDELGYLLGKVAEIKRQGLGTPAL